MSLRILYHHRIRAEDGQAVHVRELIAALQRGGHEVRECALVPKSSGSSTKDSKGSGAKGSFWQRLQLPRSAVEALEIAYNRRARSMLLAAAAEFRPDVVYERHALHCRAGLDVAKQLRVPLLLEVNSPMTDEMQRLGLLRFPRRARATERLVLSGADRVLAVTQALGDRLEVLGARRETLVVIGNGAQPERYGDEARAAAKEIRSRWGLPPSAVVLGFVGFMREWHRLDLAVDALARPEFRAAHLVLVGEGRVERDVPLVDPREGVRVLALQDQRGRPVGRDALARPAVRAAHLVLVGVGPALAGPQARAAAAGVRDRLHVVGRVPGELVPAHVCAFDVALIPAINCYASPLKLFDSMAAGVATLAPDQSNLRETVDDGVHAVLFDPASSQSFAERLRALVGDRDLRNRIGAAGAARLRDRNYTWDGNAERVERVAQALLRRGAK